MLISQVIEAGIKWLLSLLIPGAGFIKAIMAIKDIIVFFVESAIMLIPAITEAILALAAGSIAGVGKAIEFGLAKLLPLVIGLFAKLIGLGGLSKRVMKIFKKIRKRVDKAVNKLLKKAKKAGRKLMRKLGIGKGDKKGDSKEKPKNKEDHDEQVKDGLHYLDQMSNKEDKDNNKTLSLEQAEKVAQKTKSKFPVFTSIKPRNVGGKWVYDWTGSKGTKETDEKVEGAGEGPGSKEELARSKAKELIVLAQKDHDFVKMRLTEIASSTGGTLKGLEYAIKEEDSLTRKLADRTTPKVIAKHKGDLKKSIDFTASKTNDVLRFTIVLDADGYSENYERIKSMLASHGIRATGRIFNAWSRGDVTYQGLNATFVTESGQEFELQFHTPESFEAKQKSHEYYDVERDEKASLDEKRRAAEETKKIYKEIGVNTPSGAEELK